MAAPIVDDILATTVFHRQPFTAMKVMLRSGATAVTIISTVALILRHVPPGVTVVWVALAAILVIPAARVAARITALLLQASDLAVRLPLVRALSNAAGIVLSRIVVFSKSRTAGRQGECQ